MDTKSFKAFTPYLVQGYVGSNRSAFGLYAEITQSRDPSAGRWSSVGFAEVTEDSRVVDIGVRSYLFNIRFADRILPGKIIRARTQELIDEFQAKAGSDYRMSKKEKAEFRELAEEELLPKAFIRYTDVPAMLIEQSDRTFLLVFTASPKKAETASLVMLRMLKETNPDASVSLLRTVNPTSMLLRALSRDDPALPEALSPAEHFVFKNGTARARFKGLDCESCEVAEAVENPDNEPVEIGFSYGTPALQGVMTENLVFKSLKMTDLISQEELGKDDLHGHALLVSRTYMELLFLVLLHSGGISTVERNGGDDDEI